MNDECEDGPMTTTLELRPGRSTGVLRGLWTNSGMLVVFVALFVACYALVPNFASWTNMDGLMLSVATIGIISCTMLFCLAAGDFDLSVGSIVAMSGVVSAVVANWTG